MDETPSLGTRAAVFLLSVLVSANWASAQPEDDADVDLGFQEKLPRWMDENHVPAVGVAVIEGGKLKEARVFGELRRGVPAPPDTIFEIASVTKPIGSIITLKLAHAGRWDLDEPLSRYWVDPDIKDDPRRDRITSRLVLSHQTGFPNWREYRPSKRLQIEFEPGTKYQYSGEGFVSMRHAMEHKFGKEFTEIARPLLFEPLGMKDTRFFWDDGMDESRFAVPHDKDGNPLKPVKETRRYTPAGSMLTTVGDYGHFGAEVVNGAGLSEELFNDMVSSQVALPESEGRSLSYGLGWLVVEDLSDGEYALAHEGMDPGIRTCVILLPKSRRGLVVLTNGDGGAEVYKRILVESLDMGKEVATRLKMGE